MQLNTAWALLVLLGAEAAALADGSVTVRGAYYKERSTRVAQPMVDARLDAGDNGQVDAHFLVDTITSASAAAGAAGSPFNETRVEFGGAYAHRFSNIEASMGVRISHEPDYKSRFVNARAKLDLAQKNTTLFAGAAFGADSITNGSAQGGIAAATSGSLRTWLGSLSLAQVLSRRVTASLTYDLAFLRGYQENPYRSVAAGGTLVPERVPDKRYRHAAALGVRGAVPGLEMVIAGSYRFYVDNWGVLAHTPEVRLVQPFGNDVYLQTAYRFYCQTSADFFRPIYDSADEMVEPHLTDDAKLASMTTHTLGAKLDVSLRALGVTGTHQHIRTEIAFDYLVQNSRFGNAIQGTVAVVWPFDY